MVERADVLVRTIGDGDKFVLGHAGTPSDIAPPLRHAAARETGSGSLPPIASSDELRTDEDRSRLAEADPFNRLLFRIGIYGIGIPAFIITTLWLMMSGRGW